MPKEFKLTKPLDMPVELRRARGEVLRADQLAEHAHMRLFEVYRVLKFSEGLELTPEGRKALERLDRATSILSDVRGALGDAAYQVEQVLREAGREP